MAINPSRLAYQDCYDLLEKAISSDYPTGLRIKFANRREATHFRQRLHNARYVDRIDNTKVYPDGHPMFGKSVYDVVNCRIRETTDVCWLRLERSDTRRFDIEPIEPEDDFPIKMEPTPAVIQNGGGQNLVVQVMPIRKFPRRF